MLAVAGKFILTCEGRGFVAKFRFSWLFKKGVSIGEAAKRRPGKKGSKERAAYVGSGKKGNGGWPSSPRARIPFGRGPVAEEDDEGRGKPRPAASPVAGSPCRRHPRSEGDARPSAPGPWHEPFTPSARLRMDLSDVIDSLLRPGPVLSRLLRLPRWVTTSGISRRCFAGSTPASPPSFSWSPRYSSASHNRRVVDGRHLQGIPRAETTHGLLPQPRQGGHVRVRVQYQDFALRERPRCAETDLEKEQFALINDANLHDWHAKWTQLNW